MIRKLTSLPFCIPLALLAMLVMTTRSSATDKQAEARTSAVETPGFSSSDKSGGQCRAPIVGDVTRSELQGLATVVGWTAIVHPHQKRRPSTNAGSSKAERKTTPRLATPVTTAAD